MYSVTNANGTLQNISTAFSSVTSCPLNIQAAGLRRFKVFDFSIGVIGPPNATDCSINWDFSRSTSSNGGTTVTANPYDGSDIAATIAAQINFSGTTVAVAAQGSGLGLWSIGLNQRNSFRWACAPGFEYVSGATSQAGFAWRAYSATYASTVSTTGHWIE
jgi:hypothetical protein